MSESQLRFATDGSWDLGAVGNVTLPSSHLLVGLILLPLPPTPSWEPPTYFIKDYPLQNDTVIRQQQPQDVIFSLIREMAPPGVKTVNLADARERTLAKGFTPDQFDEAIEEYEDLNVWQVNAAKTKITLI
uniref:Uncharacterized protein n=1 Tax=Branchiostoma floridae TaxID=7739 RepID=C3ZEX5_BRAFL|eukprot:XP_002593270.1 hypothetical protein BRAFLDRAFT_83815 [Branchiostoma floridae]